MNEKQQQLLFDKGITNVPSDILCSDNTLEESVGMIYDDGEHKVIQDPELYMNTNNTESGLPCYVVYVHNYNEKRYIYVSVEDGSGGSLFHIKWGTKSGNTLTNCGDFFDTTAMPKVTSVGKTLIITDTKNYSMHYYLWKKNETDGDIYYPLGDIPDSEFTFAIQKGKELEYERRDIYTTDHVLIAKGYVWLFKNRYVSNTAGSNDIIYERDEGRHPYIEPQNQEDYNNLIIGLYARNKKSISDKKMFCEPFFVRTALEMYDGTYTHISQPILMFPSIRDNTIGLYVFNENAMTMVTEYGQLLFKQTKDFSDWSDIIKDVVIFASDSVSPYDTTTDQDSADAGRNLIDGIKCDGVFLHDTQVGSLSQYDSTEYDAGEKMIARFSNGSYIGNSYPLQVLKKKTDEDILRELESVSVFYKLCKVGLKAIERDVPATKYIEPGVLTNLVTQEQLPEDDYFSRCNMFPQFMYSYNSRLNLANVERSFYKGYDYFMPWDHLATNDYTIYVTIKTDEGDVRVGKDVSTKQKMGYYFYYPDSRASKVVIIWHHNNIHEEILNTELTEHPGLNGAYYFAGLPGNNSVELDTSGDADASETSLQRERLGNYIITSEVNNPCVFKAEGYNKVGTGKIIGMSTTTMALSNDAYGRNDLIVFSESGLWGMSVDGTGLYQSIHPFSREVCNNSDSITPVDGAVFFSSEKGLMMVTDKGVSCVSEQLSGREYNFSGEIQMGNFRDYLKECFIAYDYRDSLLWIFNNSRSVNNNYCYVYSIKHGTFGKYRFNGTMQKVVSDYPDTLLQRESAIYTLLNRDNINLDNTNYSGLMISRPMKFENGLALKSLMDVRNIRQMQGSLTLRVFASNNLNSWVELNSLRGTPWKYFRFRFDFSNMKATDRFSGSVIVTQERRTDKIR